MIDILKIKNEALFDEKQEELSDKEKKLIQENKDLFQLQFETHKGTIVRNLDKANKKLLGNMYKTDTDVKAQMDRLENDIQQDSKVSKYYQRFIKRLEKIKNPQKKEERKLMGLMQLASMKCIALMNAEMQKKWKKGDTIEQVLSSSFYKVKNSGVDGIMGPNTTSVFMDILSRDTNLPAFDGTISKELIKKIYDECQPTAPITQTNPTENKTTKTQEIPESRPKKTKMKPETTVDDVPGTKENANTNPVDQTPTQTPITQDVPEKIALPDEIKLYTVLTETTDKTQRVQMLAGINDMANLEGAKDNFVKKIRELPEGEDKGPYQERAQEIVTRLDQLIQENTPSKPKLSQEEIETKYASMNESLQHTFGQIKDVLELNAKIEGLKYEDFAFAEIIDGKKITKTVTYKGILIVSIGIDIHEDKPMKFTRRGEGEEKRFDEDPFEETGIIGFIKNKAKQIDEQNSKNSLT